MTPGSGRRDAYARSKSVAWSSSLALSRLPCVIPPPPAPPVSRVRLLVPYLVVRFFRCSFLSVSSRFRGGLPAPLFGERVGHGRTWDKKTVNMADIVPILWRASCPSSVEPHQHAGNKQMSLACVCVCVVFCELVMCSYFYVCLAEELGVVCCPQIMHLLVFSIPQLWSQH